MRVRVRVGVRTGNVKSSADRVGMVMLDIYVVLDSVCVCVWERRGGERMGVCARVHVC